MNNLQECAKTALNYFQTANAGFNEISYAKRLQGFAYLISKDYDQAIMSFKECFLLWQNISLYSLELANSLNDIGRAYRYSQNFLESEVFFQKALDMSINLNYNDGIATYTGNLANVALDQEHWEEAEIRARDALELAEKLGRKLIIGNALVYIGRALIGQKRYREAITYLQESIAIYTHLSSPRINEANELLIKCKQSL